MTDKSKLIEQIDAILPQTQCGQCGYSGCLPYATAIAEGNADINQCPPGDAEGIRKLAALLGVAFKPLNTLHGVPKPKSVAFINEEQCIGCTFCLQACPVDAIVGAAKQMHTILAAECTGCERCVAPCPVDCISMIPAEPYPASDAQEMKQKAADRARIRHQSRLQRLVREKQQQAQKLAQKSQVVDDFASETGKADLKKTAIQAAMARVLATRTETSDRQ
ncbi:MAG TPA: electron transport complex subunit RsxB [Nitrosomonas nitrosa]|uniref:Electron transport complex protein RnfB n=1 Tax=Nitrosomonas nitrosa TaxID=52442 RepID=A0A1I4NWC5_9PROT|nr:electron transport complex subunit RsxB [Nitrosomonas nitrosa]MCO6435062.1 electron transport complex subunit RsxB [Nitrosomonas nitrosa]SFM19831.1 electron transport complex protein RnfB [Nitrosomonas nitrosa]HBZ30821.1 electron transport complex subunit RsxB [Nitrosomonas nitrosa]HNP50266.1 electron transport complex subunit RsxB [Nitrosomonas nitrosa]